MLKCIMVSDKLTEAIKQVLCCHFFFFLSQILPLNNMIVSALELVNGVVVPLAWNQRIWCLRVIIFQLLTRFSKLEIKLWLK